MRIKDSDLNTHTTGRVLQYRNFIAEFLKQRGAASAEELETAIFRQFADQFTEEDRSWVHHLGTRKRTVEKWRNDVHWARAWLTRSGKTLTVTVTGQDWLALAPGVVGRIDGVGPLVTADGAEMIIQTLIRQVAGLSGHRAACGSSPEGG
jgi:hypothetical protein